MLRDNCLFIHENYSPRNDSSPYNAFPPLQGFLFATEVRHFCAQLRKGNVRSVEALCAPPESLILCSPEWFGLVGLVDPVSLLQV